MFGSTCAQSRLRRAVASSHQVDTHAWTSPKRGRARPQVPIDTTKKCDKSTSNIQTIKALTRENRSGSFEHKGRSRWEIDAEGTKGVNPHHYSSVTEHMRMCMGSSDPGGEGTPIKMGEGGNGGRWLRGAQQWLEGEKAGQDYFWSHETRRQHSTACQRRLR